MTISTSQQKYNYYRGTGKKRLHICDNAPISADYLEQRVADLYALFRENAPSPAGQEAKQRVFFKLFERKVQ